MIFSVSVPVFRQAEFLPTALASVTAQSSAYELAVMDATPDNSVQDVLTTFSNHIDYSRHSPDEGQAAAIQEGWDHTTGDIVCWLCADDYLFPNTFEQVACVFEANPGVDVVYGDSVFVDRDGGFIRYFPSINDDISRIVRECCISQPSCFVRRAAVEQVGGLNPDLHYVMDWDLWTRLFEAGAKFHYLEKPLSVTRMYADTKTSSNSKERFSEIREHLHKHTGYLSSLRSLLDFRLAGQSYPELGHSRFPKFERAFFISWVMLWRAKARLIGQRNPQAGNILYGLDAVTNKVNRECRVYLPLYGRTPPRVLVVNTETPVMLNPTLNGSRLPPAAPVVDGPGYKHVFVLPLAQAPTPSLLEIHLESREMAEWHLVGLYFE